mmetsp:Transcript_29800/g.50497  ORF Transcript_29800/g.50497 Transcript_29800/m.50497 type:complete len:86 (-) Transcript_29800:500-757(-)
MSRRRKIAPTSQYESDDDSSDEEKELKSMFLKLQQAKAKKRQKKKQKFLDKIYDSVSQVSKIILEEQKKEKSLRLTILFLNQSYF